MIAEIKNFQDKMPIYAVESEEIMIGFYAYFERQPYQASQNDDWRQGWMRGASFGLDLIVSMKTLLQELNRSINSVRDNHMENFYDAR